MRANLLIITTLSALVAGTPASATVLINGDNGGKLEDYTSRFRQVRDSGETVVIDGACMSACTMVLGLVPRDRICATSNAVLGFHSAWEYNTSGVRLASPSGTHELMRSYPSAVRAWIARHGGLTPNVMYLRGRELTAIVTPCDASALRSASAGRSRGSGSVRASSRGDPRRASFDAR